MRNIKLLVTGLACAIGLPLQAADGLDEMLACTDANVLARGHESLSAAAGNAGFTCREHSGVRTTRLSCSGGRARAFGAAVRDFELAQQADGSRILSVVLDARPAAVRTTGRNDAAADSPDVQIEVDTREDGRAEVRCRLPGTLPPHGAVAGTLDFRGEQPVPAMRVCATRVDRSGEPACVLTSTGQRDYLIENLPAGDYYLTAFATESNPNRLFGVYASPMADCAETSGCERQRLQRVTVLPGDTLGGINPNTLLPELPAVLRRH